MEQVLELLDEGSYDAKSIRQPTGQFAAALNTIKEAEDNYGALIALARYDRESENGKAATARQSLMQKYGKTEAVSGFKFLVVRSKDGKTDILAATYHPAWIVEGEWDRFQDEKAAVREKARVKAAEKAAAGTVEMENVVPPKASKDSRATADAA